MSGNLRRLGTGRTFPGLAEGRTHWEDLGCTQPLEPGRREGSAAAQDYTHYLSSGILQFEQGEDLAGLTATAGHDIRRQPPGTYIRLLCIYLRQLPHHAQGHSLA